MSVVYLVQDSDFIAASKTVLAEIVEQKFVNMLPLSIGKRLALYVPFVVARTLCVHAIVPEVSDNVPHALFDVLFVPVHNNW